MSEEDTIKTGYKHTWSSFDDSPGITLDDYLNKYRPSMVQNDGTKPWIWVRGSSPSRQDTGVEEAVEEAKAILQDTAQKVEDIKNDESIPVRSNKKTGAKSKKEVREQVQTEAAQKFKEIALKHGYLGGKWLIFAPADKVDIIWSGIARSLVSGPLASTEANTAKVSTSPEGETINYQHIICVYLPNVYDKEKVTEVMKILLRNHGVNLSGVKSDLYTRIGLDSKHPSGVPSTIWKNTAILTDKESKELKDAFFAEASEAKGTAQQPSSNLAGSSKEPSKPAEKGKPKLKKPSDDPFASDDEIEEIKAEEPKPAAAAKSKLKLKKKVAEDPFASEDEDTSAPPKHKASTATSKGAPSAPKRAQYDSGDEEEEEEEPKRKRGKKAI